MKELKTQSSQFFDTFQLVNKKSSARTFHEVVSVNFYASYMTSNLIICVCTVSFVFGRLGLGHGRGPCRRLYHH